MLELTRNHEHHDMLVCALQRDYAAYIGRQLIDAYAIENDRPSIVVYDTPLLGTRRPDLAAIVQSGLGMHLTALIEIKRSVNDLSGAGPQLSDYIGNTTCLFIAVPEEMLGACICQIQTPRNLRLYKGVINAGNGDIVVLPLRQNCSFFKEAGLLCNIAAERRFMADESGIYRLHDIPIRASKSVFADIDGMAVRNKYADIFREQVRNRYPTPQGMYMKNSSAS